MHTVTLRSVAIVSAHSARTIAVNLANRACWTTLQRYNCMDPYHRRIQWKKAYNQSFTRLKSRRGEIAWDEGDTPNRENYLCDY